MELSENVLTDTQDQVVDGQEQDINALDGAQGSVVENQEPNSEAMAEQGEQGEVADPQKPVVQSREENAALKATRLRTAQETEAKVYKQVNDNIARAGMINPYTNTPILTIEDMDAYTEAAQQAQLQAQAEQSGIPLEKLQAEYEEKKELERKLEALQSENETYKQKEISRVLSDDLSELQKKYPELVNTKDVKEIGDTFIKLRAADVDLQTAYEAAKAEKERNTKPVPPTMGAVNTGISAEKDFYTSAEVDRLSKKDLDNPTIRKKVIQSMTKW